MKTNKTKPIKKIMIFTIITVMIVSLFAVPAFADVTWPSVSGNVAPINFTYESDEGTLSVNTNDYYLITFTMASLRSALSHVSSENLGSSFTLQPFNHSGYSSYTRVLTTTADEYYYKNMIDGPNDLYVLKFDFTGGSEELVMSVPNGVSRVTYDLNNQIRAPEQISFIVSQYPFVVSSTGLVAVFWNNLDFTVQKYTNETTPPTNPDPEEPTDPTPPADGEEQGIFAVWSQITQWIVQGLASVSNAFYADGKLTLLGTLCIIPLALGLAFLLIGIIQKFLRLRG